MHSYLVNKKSLEYRIGLYFVSQRVWITNYYNRAGINFFREPDRIFTGHHQLPKQLDSFPISIPIFCRYYFNFTPYWYRFVKLKRAGVSTPALKTHKKTKT